MHAQSLNFLSIPVRSKWAVTTRGKLLLPGEGSIDHLMDVHIQTVHMQNKISGPLI
jgi:hypothetical protein